MNLMANKGREKRATDQIANKYLQAVATGRARVLSASERDAQKQKPERSEEEIRKANQSKKMVLKLLGLSEEGKRLTTNKLDVLKPPTGETKSVAGASDAELAAIGDDWLDNDSTVRSNAVPAADKFFLFVADKSYGPFEAHEVFIAIAEKKVVGETPVWIQGDNQWRRIHHVPAFAAELKKVSAGT